MTPGLNQEWVDYVIEVADQQSLSSIWYYSQFENLAFEERCEAFYWILEMVLESGQLRLRKYERNGEYLTGTPKELVQRFRDVFPKADVRDTVDDMRFWFYGDPPDPCPAIAVWRYEHPDGRVEWIPCP
jgi:hypothetical protein